MTYCETFSLREKPFCLAADPMYLYMSAQHWEALAHLMYGVDDDWGFVLVTGEIGAGKTTLCRFLLDQMPKDIEVAYLINPGLTVQELLLSVCDEFRISHPQGMAGVKELFDSISSHLIDLHAKGRKTLLIIDEAQCLSSEVMEQLRLLTNLETSDCKLLRIILLGQPELREKLNSPGLEQMSQRITARYHLGPLSRKDVVSYVRHRLTVAGGRDNIFTGPALWSLFRLSKGVPRLINVICDRALLGACMRNERFVSRATLVKAAAEIFRGAEFGSPGRKTYGLRWVAAGLGLGLLVSALFLGGRDLSPQPAVSPLAVAGVTKTQGLPAVSWWPRGEDQSAVRDGAYRALMESRGYSYYSTYSTGIAADMFCSDVELLELRCSKKRMAKKDLRAIPVPSVLALSDREGNKLSVALLKVHADQARLRIGSSESDIAAEEVRSLWTGEYTMLEPMQRTADKTVRTGMKKVFVRGKGQ